MIGIEGIVWIASGITSYFLCEKWFDVKPDIANFGGAVLLGPISLILTLTAKVFVKLRKYKLEKAARFSDTMSREVSEETLNKKITI